MSKFFTSRVSEFIKAMSLEDRGTDFWDKLILEEEAEVLKEVCDYIYVCAGRDLADHRWGDEVESALWLAEQMFDPDTVKEAFLRVHESNMSKLVDGKPVYDENGKVMKGPNYKAPDLRDLV